MSDVKHTPGPHYAAAQNDALYVIAGRSPSPDNDYPMHDADRTVLAKIYFGDGAPSFDEARANSRLYAAAPDLLAALKATTEMLATWTADHSMECTAQVDAVLHVANTAITRASRAGGE